ncbi:hypothetical protein KV097_04455 [Mumia sp. zg.B17]|uniref:DUF6571 family protein n=1 Tax=Mumia sp. zg.B17 TaxID=2855446 RepID=UPI001C6E2F74|nr:DUF6571 family protein [Mumia sp. zg.B17]MBW9205185.1 hypothetical protein [Mumia sp. zg.B17]
MIATAMEGADTPTKNIGRNLIQGITIGAGAIRLFGTAVETFNNTIDGLNSQIRSEATREEQIERKSTLSGQHAGAVQTLQSAARTAKGQLSDPLKPAHVEALYAAGALPSFAPEMFRNVADLKAVKLTALPFDVANMSAEDQAKYVIDHAKDLDAQFIALLSPAVRGLVAEAVAKDIRTKAIDEDTAATLALMKDDAAFAHRLYSTVTPDQMADAIFDLSNEVFPPGTFGPPDQVERAKVYAEFLAGAGHAFATYTKATGAHAPPQDLSDQWFRAITDETNPENAAALTMLIKHGGKTASYDPTFLADLTDQVYDWERSHDGMPVWGPINDSFGTGYGVKEPYYDLGKPGDPYDDTAHYQVPYDGLANLLSGMAKTPEAAEQFFDDPDTTRYHDRDVNEKLHYLFTERKWPTDDGDGFGVALEGATTHSRDVVSKGDLGGETAQSRAATLASQTVFIIGQESGTGDGPWPGDDGWHVPEGMTDSVGKMLASYIPDVHRAAQEGNGDSLDGGWTYDASDGKGGVALGMRANVDDLTKVLQDVGRYDDKTGLQYVTTAALTHHNATVANALDTAVLPDGSHPTTLKELSASNFEELLGDASSKSGRTLALVMNEGFLGGKDGEAATQEQREALAKAFGVATEFLPPVANPVGSVLTGQALGLVGDQLAAQPDSAAQSWA